MRNLVRGGVLLLVTGLFVVFIYAQTRTETPLSAAKVSQQEIQNNLNKSNTDKVNKTVVTKDAAGKAKAAADDSQTEIEADEAETAAIEGDQGKKLVKKTASVRAVATSRGSFSATAYCLSGRTAMGHSVRRGLIAADPRILPLGSKVVIQAGPWSGTYIVSDTGSGIKGKEIDIWVASCSEARRFGRRTVQVSLLK
ncbi:MAG: 3D domain-containing protein [Acidobacteria bacterium OLB17]|nr:MAG: 3D domain-containing protein [Acidobacteria bacterium OLB17]MCZ2390362.1 3D domain-containing protein [Acidobacteriota bacterium]